MSLQSGYTLSKLRVVLNSKLREDLAESIQKLKQSLIEPRQPSELKLCSGSTNENIELPFPAPSRLGRRAWRVWYNKAPHAIGWSKRHYIFHDWRYAFDFRNVGDIKRTMSTVLGSMATDTSCVAQFNWFLETGTRTGYPETPSYILSKGYENNLRKNAAIQELKNSDNSHQKHSYLNYRQYVGKGAS